MISKRNFSTLILAVAISGGTGVFFGSHSRALAEDKTMTNADFARDAEANLKKAHEDVDHLVDSATDKNGAGYQDADEAKKAIDRAEHAIHRYLGLEDSAPAAPKKKK